MNFQELLAPPVEINSVLNPKLWDHDSLKSSVRGALLRMAEDFSEFIGVPVDVIDVVITGGNANYTYTTASDVDLHLIADFDKVSCDREVHELMDTKRLLYRENRQLEVYGIPVELYVEDKDMPAQSGGCYSVVNDKWLRKPTKNLPKIDQAALEHWVTVWHTVIKYAIRSGDLTLMRKTMSMLRNYRRLGLHQDSLGEFSTPNLVFKSLRNDQTVRALQKLIDVAHDRSLSI